MSNEWMNEWMNGWMDGWMDGGWTDGWMDGWTNKQTNRQMHLARFEWLSDRVYSCVRLFSPTPLRSAWCIEASTQSAGARQYWSVQNCFIRPKRTIFPNRTCVAVHIVEFISACKKRDHPPTPTPTKGEVDFGLETFISNTCLWCTVFLYVG